MKKNLKIMLVVMLIIILSFATNSLAATYELEMTSSKSSIAPGEEVSITVSLKNGSGLISGLSGTLEYNSNIFTLTNKVMESEGTISVNDSNNSFSVILNSDINTGKIFTLTFIANQDVSTSVNDIKLTNIKLADEKDATVRLDDQSISINVIGNSSDDNNNGGNNGDTNDVPQPAKLTGIKITKTPTTVEYTEGQKFNLAGMEMKAIYEDGTEKVITNYTYSPNGELKTENKLITFSYQEDGVTKTATQTITVKAKSNNNNNNTTNNTTNNTANNTTNNTTNTDNTVTTSGLPSTGNRTYILVIIAGLIGVGAVSYIGYRKYKEI